MKIVKLSALILMSAAVSCDPVGRTPGNEEVPGGHNPVHKDFISVEFLAHDEPYEGCVPRLAATYGEWTMFETTRQDEDDFISLLFVKEGDKNCYLATLTDGTVSFSSYSDVLVQDVPDEVMSLWYEDGKLVVYSAEVDQETGMLCSISRVTEDDFPEENMSHIMPVDYFDDLDREIRSTVLGFFDDLGSKISEMGSFLSLIPYSSSGSIVTSMWTKVFIPLAKASLCPDSYENLDGLLEEQISIIGKQIVVSLLPRSVTEINRKFKKGMLLYKYGDYIFGDEEVDDMMSDEELLTTAESWNYKSLWSMSQNQVMEEYSEKYEMTVRVSDVTESGARLSSSFYDDGTLGFVSSSGYRYSAEGGKEQEIVSDRLFADAVLSGLESGTKYYAYAYARSMGMEYRSGRISFMTLGGFSVSPTDLEFSSEGGTKGVSVTYSNDDVKSWRISSSPRWCRVEKGDRMFFVTVDESRKNREGTITVTAVFKDGTSQDRDVLVSQTGELSWDNTSWQCSGTVHASFSDGDSYDGMFEFGLDIISVEDNVFYVTGDMAGDYEMYCDENGMLVFEYSESISSGGITTSGEIVMTIKRIDYGSISGTISGTSTTRDEDEVIHLNISGEFTGSMI